MTRFSLNNEKYTCAYGVDHHLGRFLQIYRANPARMEEEVPLVDIDEATWIKLLWSEDHGETLSPDDYETTTRELVKNHLGPEVWAHIERLELAALSAAPTRLEVDDVLGLLRALGFSEPMLALVRGGLGA